MRTSDLVVAIITGSLLVGWAEPGQTGDDKLVEIRVQIVRATPQQLEKVGTPSFLLFEGQKQRVLSVTGVLTGNQTQEALARFTEAGAPVVTSARSVVLTGHAANWQNAREFRYPTKYSEPDNEGKMFPLSFEMKKVGTLMEATAKVCSGSIELAVSLSITALTNYKDYSAPTGDMAPNNIWMPVFSTQEVTTSVSLYSGETVAISGPGESKDEPWYVIFVTAWEVIGDE